MTLQRKLLSRTAAATIAHMDQDRSQSSSGRVAVAAVAIAFIILPTLYILSFGPVAGLALRGYLPSKPVQALYYPIKVLHDEAGPPISTMLENYLKIFEP